MRWHKWKMSNITARIRDQIASLKRKNKLKKSVRFLIGDGIVRVIGLTKCNGWRISRIGKRRLRDGLPKLRKNDVGSHHLLRI